MKHIVITGANRGLGLGFCRQYLAEGNLVTATFRSLETTEELSKLLQQYKQQLQMIQLDVTDESMINNLVKKFDSPIDILINNSGIYGSRNANIGNLEQQNWIAVMHTNSIAPLLVAQALLPQITKSLTKKIVFISSKMGSIDDNQSGASYCYRSSKAALNAGAKSLALDLKDKGIYVGILHPGWVRTDMGGPQGLIDINTSVAGMKNVIESLNKATTGVFLNYDGTKIAW